MQTSGLETNMYKSYLQLHVGQRLHGTILIYDCSWALKILGPEEGSNPLSSVLDEGVKAQKGKWFAQGLTAVSAAQGPDQALPTVGRVLLCVHP